MTGKEIMKNRREQRHPLTLLGYIQKSARSVSVAGIQETTSFCAPRKLTDQ